MTTLEIGLETITKYVGLCLSSKQVIRVHNNLVYSSVRKFGGTTKTRHHRSRRFLKNSVKISENQKNSAEMHQRRRRNSENRKH
jgi:transposase